MITWRGISYALLTLLVYLVLAYSSFSLLSVLLLVLLLLPVLSILQILVARSHFSFSQRLNPPVIEREDPVGLLVSLEQKGWLSHGEIELVVSLPGERGQPIYERRLLPLLSGTANLAEFPINCPHRGLYAAGLVSIRSRDLLGLFYLPLHSRRHCRRRLLQLTIMPRPRPILSATELASLLSAWQQQAIRIGDEVDAVANLRAHRPGDSLKRTHWKLSARMNQIMIKEFENPILKEGLLILDLARPDGRRLGPTATLDLADFFTERAAFLAQLILDTGNHLRAVSYQDDGRQEYLAELPTDLHQMQLQLASLGWSEKWPADQVLAEETRQNRSFWFVMLLTTRLDAAIAQQLQALQTRGLSVWLLLVQMAENLPSGAARPAKPVETGRPADSPATAGQASSQATDQATDQAAGQAAVLASLAARNLPYIIINYPEIRAAEAQANISKPAGNRAGSPGGH